ncbi:MAG: radical SAM/SPASM domain-containing protein [Candidatus Electryonea clarkiae]|nr:radical SAM/SPASM domain-containing protein [Candidatus Electryonea clarkiae]
MLLSRVTRKQVLLGMPVMLMVEPGTACQLRCPHCPTGRGDLSRQAGRLSFDNFRKIWDTIKPAPVRLQLWNQGEPLTNPDTPKIIRYAARSGSWVVMATNVELLAKKELAEEIVASGLYEVVLSLDGASDNSHIAYREGGDFSKVETGIRNLVEAKKRLKLKYPLLTWQFIMFRHNLHEMTKAKQLAKKWGVDRIQFKTAQLEDLSKDEGEKWLPDSPKLRRYKFNGDNWLLKRRERFFCDRLFSTAVILWDGTVVPCCFDKDGSYPMGNALENTFPEVWHSKDYHKFRSEWIKGNRPEMCDNCTEGLRGLYF